MKLKNKKTGKIGWLYEHSLVQDIIIVYDVKGIVGKYTSLAELNEEWEDAPEEPKEWWYIDIHGPHKVTNNDEYYQQVKAASKEIGNCFETREEAELAVRKLKAWKRLKEKNFHFLKYSALGCGEIEFSLDFEDMEDEGEIGELRKDLDICFGGEE